MKPKITASTFNSSDIMPHNMGINPVAWGETCPHILMDGDITSNVPPFPAQKYGSVSVWGRGDIVTTDAPHLW